MEKTTVYLTSEQKAALARAAAAEGRSEARLIRAGIDVVTARHRSAETPASPLADATVGSATPVHLERPRWIDRDGFLRLIGGQADPELGAELRELVPGTTDDEPLS